MSTILHEAFKEACKLFNAGKYEELGKVSDPDVIMKRVDDPGSIAGIGNFVVYLKTHQGSEKPQIEIETINVENEIVRGAAQTNGQISGTAEYRDKATDKETIPIRFAFTFTRKDNKAQWLLINVFAAPLK
jgi:hypothetical protein